MSSNKAKPAPITYGDRVAMGNVNAAAEVQRLKAAKLAKRSSRAGRKNQTRKTQPLSGKAALEDLRHRAQHLFMENNDLDMLGVSVHWLQHGLLKEVKAAGFDRSATIYDIEDKIILTKGKNLLSPCDGKKGTSYAHALLTLNEGPIVQKQKISSVGPAKFMLSYGWGYQVGDIVDTLVDYCTTSNLDPMKTYIWICCLCINQHRVAEQKACGGTGMLNFEQEFPVTIANIGHMLAMMAPWQNPLYMTRVWCIFELYTAHRQTECNLSILMPPKEKEALKKSLFEAEEENDVDIDEGVKSLYQALSNTKVQEAQASIPSDRTSILKMIEEDVGCRSLNHKVNELLRTWVFNVVSSFAEEWNSKTKGLQSAEAATAFLKIGQLFSAFDEYDAAHKEFQKALVIRESLLGKEHPGTATCYSYLGSSLENMGKYKEALQELKKALDIRESVLGEQHRDTAETYSQIGSVCDAMGHHGLALTYHKKCLAVRETIFGTNHRRTAQVYNNIGMSHYQKAPPNYDEALVQVQKALTIEETVLGSDHPATAVSHSNMGMILRSKGDYEGALAEYRKALAVSESVLGVTHTDTATTHNSIGALLHFQGDYPGALMQYKKALSVFQSVYGEKHPSIATSHSNIGFVLHLMEDNEAALVEFRKAWDIREEVFGKHHPKTQDTLKMINMAMKAKWKDISDRSLEFEAPSGQDIGDHDA